MDKISAKKVEQQSVDILCSPDAGYPGYNGLLPPITTVASPPYTPILLLARLHTLDGSF